MYVHAEGLAGSFVQNSSTPRIVFHRGTYSLLAICHALIFKSCSIVEP